MHDALLGARPPEKPASRNSSSIVGLSAIPGGLLVDYLRRRKLGDDLIRWKYLDQAFNRGRERGLAWVKDDRVQGMVGMIPGDLGNDGDSRSVNWACDWSIENPDAAPGMGCLLLRKAAQASDSFLAFGGNQNSLKLLPRMASHADEKAGVVYHVPLRLGPILEKAGRRFPALAISKWPLLPSLPFRKPGGSLDASVAGIEPGVSGALRPVMERRPGSGWSPRYDLEYVDWQVGRCPLLMGFTCTAPVDNPRAAVLFWRRKTAPARWRGALWAAPGDESHLEAALNQSLIHVYRSGGALFSVLVSRLDTVYRDALRKAGGMESARRVPLFFLAGKDPSPPPSELGHLSYLDSDYAYLF